MRLFRKSQLLVLFAASCTLVAVAFMALQLYGFYRVTAATVDANAILVVKKNSSGRNVVQTLYEGNLVQSPRFIYFFTRISGFLNHLKAGVYAIEPSDTASSLLKKIEHGEVLQLPFVIIAGKTWYDLLQQVQSTEWLERSSNNSYDVLGKVAATPEGLFLADTYAFDAGSSAQSIFKHANLALNDFLQKNWMNRAPGLPYLNPYELLIAASIIEKETGVANERPMIASVIANRLIKGMPLQMDPTVIYALGPKWQGTLSRTDLDIKSPYNTYKYKGLPPTPISMVSRQSIEAAAHPAQTDYLYFVAKGDGTHQFSINYKQQRLAVERYIKRR